MWQYEEKNKKLAQSNRKLRNATKQEGVLWHCYLKTCPVRFTRQYRIENYIVDFFAPTIKLAIEIDGGQHYEEKNEQSERERTRLLEEKGITVLRFTNQDIDCYLKRTVDQIVYVIETLKGGSIY